MIKIKDLIINENEIVYIEEFDTESLAIMFKGKDKATFVDAHTEDIEWNYGGQVSSQVSGQVEDTLKDDEYIELSNKYQRLLNRNEELEEEHKELVETNYNLATKKTELEEENKKLKDKVLELSNHLSLYSSEETLLNRINKAIEYIEEYYPTSTINYQYEKDEIIKILKGEENEN